MKPEVSIITPAFNAANTILRAYESILNQTFQDWEWVLVDDCSTDDTKKIISKLVEQDKRVKLFFNETNKGAAYTRNTALENAKGRFVAFLDADDTWKPNKLSSQIEFMKNNNIALSFTDYEVVFSNSNKILYKSRKRVVSYKDLLKTDYIGCLTVVVDTSKVGEFRMPVDCPKREDHAAWLDLTRDGSYFYCMDGYLATYYIAQSSVSSKKHKMIKYQFNLYRKHEKMGFFKSTFYLLCVIYNKVFRKYKY